jgi:hypothetical protein
LRGAALSHLKELLRVRNSALPEKGKDILHPNRISLRIVLDPFQELYNLAISEIFDDLKYIKLNASKSSEKLELISSNLVVQALMRVFVPHLYKTYFSPGIRLLDKDEVQSILAVIYKQIEEKGIHIEEEEVILMERAIERLLVSQGWSREAAWERASYLSREFTERLITRP